MSEKKRNVEMSGLHIASLQRSDSGKSPQELRVSVDEFNGHHFIRASVWVTTATGTFPLPNKQITIRRAELRRFINAMLDAEDALELIDAQAEFAAVDVPVAKPLKKTRRQTKAEREQAEAAGLAAVEARILARASAEPGWVEKVQDQRPVVGGSKSS